MNDTYLCYGCGVTFLIGRPQKRGTNTHCGEPKCGRRFLYKSNNDLDVAMFIPPEDIAQDPRYAELGRTISERKPKPWHPARSGDKGRPDARTRGPTPTRAPPGPGHIAGD